MSDEPGGVAHRLHEKRAEAYLTLCLSATSAPLVFEPPWVDRMREARRWLEDIRQRRAAHEAWEYPAPPAFATAA